MWRNFLKYYLYLAGVNLNNILFQVENYLSTRINIQCYEKN